MTTSTPPHNLCEVIDATKAYMQNEAITTRELLRYIKGPDFPTGGIVTNKDELLQIYETGTGKIKIRGKVEFEKTKGGKTNVVITEIPYTMIGINISKFLSDVAALSETKKTGDIVDISNQSSKEGIRIVIELRKDADPENFVNLLYKRPGWRILLVSICWLFTTAGRKPWDYGKLSGQMWISSLRWHGVNILTCLQRNRRKRKSREV